MPPTPSPIDSEHPQAEPEVEAAGRTSVVASDTTGVPPPPRRRDPNVSPAPPPTPDSDAPLSFIPHDAAGAVQRAPVKIRTGRWGEMEEHELLHLLDSFEDERARARFRESIYIALFIWMALALLVVYGPRYLWHAPQVISVSDAMKAHELTTLNAPVLPPHRVALPHPALDKNTLERLRSMKPAAPAKPVPEPPVPVPVTPPPTMPLPSAPTPVPTRTPPPVVAEAPTPQPSTSTSLGKPGSARDSIESAMRGSRNGGNYGPPGGGHRSSPLNFGGVEVLSPNPDNVDLGPYLKRIIQDVYRNWYPLIPEEALPPLSKQGETLIRFKILPDGRIGAMNLDGSTHDDAINRSCWGSITSEGQFPPLPKEFHGPELELRFHYLVNKNPPE